MDQTKKLHLIELYRGIAALSVFLFHLSGIFSEKFGFDPLFGYASFGYLGVDFFFVLSGFVIYSAHSEDFSKRGKIGLFFKRRFLRIYPTYWFHLAVIALIRVAAGILIDSQFFNGLDFKNLIANITLFPAEKYLIGPAWSLSYEIYFYFVFGLFLIAPKKWLLLGLPYLAAVALLQDNQNSFVFNGHILQFAMGVMIAHVLKINSAFVFFIKRYSLTLLVSLCLLVSLTLVFLDSHHKLFHQFRIITVGTLTSFMILFSVLFERFQSKNKRPIHLHKGLLLLGASSYALYISHGIFLSLFESLFDRMRSNFSILTLSFLYAMIMIGCLTYSVIFYILLEKKILLRAKTWLDKRI